MYYKTKHIRLKMDLSGDNPAKFAACLSKKLPLASIFKGELRPEEKADPDISSWLTVEKSEKVFSDATPIENRRNAIIYANWLSELLYAEGKYYDVVRVARSIDKSGIMKV